MGLEDFERELAESKAQHQYRHRSRRHGENEEDERRRKRRRERGHDGELRHSKRRHGDSLGQARLIRVEPSPAVNDDKDEDEDGIEWVEKEAVVAQLGNEVKDVRGQDATTEKVQRDSWMLAPSALDVDHVTRKKPPSPQSHFVGANSNHGTKIHEADVYQRLADSRQNLGSASGREYATAAADEQGFRDAPYTFGDSGSSWRMTKLKAVYRQAADSGRDVDDVALERYGNLQDFDDAREEERELDRRQMYGKDFVGLEKPSGELFQERRTRVGKRHTEDGTENSVQAAVEKSRSQVMPEMSAPSTTHSLDSTALNKLKAQMMKAKLRSAPEAVRLEEEYNIAIKDSASHNIQSDVVVISDMDNRQMAGGRDREVKAVSGKRGRERGLVVENDDMSLEDMVRQEKRTRAIGGRGGEGRAFAERIARDAKFENNLDYMDEQADALSKKALKSDINLRSTAMSEFQKTQKALEACPLCHQENTNQLPSAPIVSLGTRTYLTLPTEPEVANGGAVIVPMQHRLNLLECDEDEWEEVRNFMKSLTRHYDAQDRGVVFYEDASEMHRRRRHAALNAIPLPRHLAENAPAYFREAILANAEQWSQHKPIVDTLAQSQRAGYGRKAFQRSMVKEMPYFHVWFTLDGGMGHVVEDEQAWPRGDVFAREVIGGMLGKGMELIRKQGRWGRQDRRVEVFRKKWDQWDWTKALVDAAP